MSALLEIRDLRLALPVGGSLKPVIRNVSLDIGAGEAVGLVGESGAGKSMAARAVLRLLPPGAELSGSILFDGDSVLDMDRAALRTFRTGGAAMIFQDPRAHTNPVRTVGDFLTEALRARPGTSKATARTEALRLLDEVRIADGPRRLRQYPHEFSGGMLQRVMIAAALAAAPRLLLADEPTTALDVTTQAEVMAILDELRRERGLSMLFITHDLELAAAACDRTAVMYAGSIVEDQPSAELHDTPSHPYTAALTTSRPDVARTRHRLRVLPGRPLPGYDAPSGCAFAPRCPHIQEVCEATDPELADLGAGRVACHRAGELHGHLLTAQDEEQPDEDSGSDS